MNSPDRSVEERLTTLEEQRFELTEAQINHLAEKAAERALQNIYAEVGKNFVRKALWFVGIVIVSIATYLAGKNGLTLK